jgi:glycine/D-amino acid oxidase-like deaminating enzyme
MSESFDVIVIGAGVIGAACARALALDGNRVVILERGAAASATSASGEGNLLVSDKLPGPELTLAVHSRALWAPLAATLSDELGPRFPSIEFDAKGGVVVATTDAGGEALTRTASMQRAEGIDAIELDRREAHALEPGLTDGLVSAVHYPEDAQVQPAIATEALLRSAVRAGARLVQGAEVVEGLRDPSGRLCGVRTSSGEFRAPEIAVAAGPWSGLVSERLGVAFPVRPRRGMVLVTARLDSPIRHKVYDADYVGAVESDSAALQTSAVIESTAGGTALIGSSREQLGFDDAIRVDVLREIARRALALFPRLKGTPVVRAYGGFRPFVPDHLPVIGADPRTPGLWFATGHEGAGIGLAPGTAELLADLVAGRTPPIDPAPFSPARDTLAPHLETAGAR